MEAAATTGATSRAKLPSNHHQQTNIQFFLQARCPSCCPTNSVKALKGKYHIPWTCLPQAQLGVFQLCLWPLTAPGYLGGGLPCLSSALWCQYPGENSVLFKKYFPIVCILYRVLHWEALFHRQKVADTQQNLTNYKINLKKKEKRHRWQSMHTKIC